MATLSIPTYEPGLTTASPSAGFVFAANPTSPLPPQPTATSSNGTMQPHTILGIVICLVGFVVLILAYFLISRLPCFRRPQGVLPTLPRPRSHIDVPNRMPASDAVRLSSLDTGRDLHNHNYHINGPRPRPRPPIQHVHPPVFACTEHWTQHYDYDVLYPPPYGGPSPPPYPEALQHPPQHLHSPPRAVVAA